MWNFTKNFLLDTYYSSKLPRDICKGASLSAQTLLDCYIHEPQAFWSGPKERHAKKIVKAREAFAEAGFEEQGGLAKALIRLVEETRPSHCRPFFIMGLGGSGSTWLGAILGDLPGFQYGREIYLPPAIVHSYRRRKTEDLETFIWATMLLHSWGLNCPEAPYRHEFVNSARSLFKYDIFRQIWPMGRFVFLARDPRDQIMSVTYRKKEYKNVVAPNKGDLRYLKENARKYMRNYEKFKQVSSDNVYLVRYEDLKSCPQEVVGEIVRKFQVDVSSDDLDRAIQCNDADRMRRGEIGWRGNLDEGGVSTGWREEMSETEKKFLYTILQPAIKEFGYDRDAPW